MDIRMCVCICVCITYICVFVHFREKDRNLSGSYFVLLKIMLHPLYSLMKSMQLELKGTHARTHIATTYVTLSH